MPAPLDDSPRARLERLVRAHQAAIWRYLRFAGCSAAEADDLTQDTFLAVVDRPLHGFGPGAARAYLRRVARNLVLRQRQRQRRVPTVDLDAGDAAFDWFCRNDDGARVVDALRACLARLDEPARRALALRYGEQRERREIARRLGLSSHGVKSLLQRSYARLRACITRRLGDGEE